MDLDKAFDEVLQKKDSDAIIQWAMERLVWSPESLEARSMTAFAFVAVGQGWTARDMASEILQEDPDQLWAVAAHFANTPIDRAERTPQFFEEDVFKLGPEWIARFRCIQGEERVHKLMYFQARFGKPSQRSELSENHFVDHSPNRGPGGGELGGDPFCSVNK